MTTSGRCSLSAPIAVFMSWTTASTSIPSAPRSATRISSAKRRSSSTITTRMPFSLISAPSARAYLGRKGGNDCRVELATPYRALQDSNGFGLGYRQSVRPVGQQRLEPVRHGHDPHLERDLLGAEAIGVPGSVEALVVMAND